MKRRRTFRNRSFDCLESRMCLSSVGWDGPGLGDTELSYYIGDAPVSLDRAEVEATLEEALDVWSDIVDIEFAETSMRGQRDSIDFQFAPIDGSGGTLAQAYLPDDVNPARVAGDITFDTSETWEIGNGLGSRAFDLLLVAVHEIGHALGLDHSRATGSVMKDTVSPHQSFNRLSTADIDAALSLYAAAPEPSVVVNQRDGGTSNDRTTTQLPTTPGDVEDGPSDEGDTSDDPDDRLPDRPARNPWLFRFGRPRRFRLLWLVPRSDFGQSTDDVFVTSSWEMYAWRPFGRFSGFSLPPWLRS